MTKVTVPAGVPLPLAARRIGLRGLGLPTPDQSGVNLAASNRPAISVVAGGSAHTKGSWGELVASTSEESNGLVLVSYSDIHQNGADTSTLIDVGIGAAGSEVVVVPNLAVGYAEANNYWVIPVRIPKGSRVALRSQSAVASKNTPMTATFVDLPQFKQAPSKLINLNANTATSRGTTIAAAGSANTKTSYTELVASVAQPLAGLIACPQGDGDGLFADSEGLFDVAVGAAGSEQTIAGLEDVYLVFANVGEILRRFQPLTVPCSIPAGSRLACRWQSTATTQAFDLTLLGIPAT